MPHTIKHEDARMLVQDIVKHPNIHFTREEVLALQYASDYMHEPKRTPSYTLHRDLEPLALRRVLMASHPHVPRWLTQRTIANLNDAHGKSLRYNDPNNQYPVWLPTASVFVDNVRINHCVELHPQYQCVVSYRLDATTELVSVPQALIEQIACDPSEWDTAATRHYYGRICVLDDRMHHAR